MSWNLNDQLWQITSAGNGYYKLINKKWGMLLHNTGGPRIWGFRELIT
ncbi:RICIN domain-containing protein [Paenibacillus taihuensis]|nr:RICIN domain-containing protein [Paenibacillus taihuensis]